MFTTMTGILKFFFKLCGVIGKVLEVVAQFSFCSAGRKWVQWKNKISNILSTISPIFFKLLSRFGKKIGYPTKPVRF